MRDLRLLDAFRIQSPIHAAIEPGPHESEGAFLIPSKVDGQQLVVIASTGLGWDHVSVSRRNRCPNWAEMEQVKRLFFRDDETAMQLHVPPSDHVNLAPTCLHLWRPNDGREIPRPPRELVGAG
jgi:hypothetical protein